MSLLHPAQPPAEKLVFISHPGVLARLLAELGGATDVGEAGGRLFMLDPALALLALEALGQLHPGCQLADMQFEQHLARLDPVTVKSLALASAAEQLASPPFSPEALETGWRKALATAHFSRALAEKAGYPGLDEAWLAGLLCWLPRFARNAGSDAEAGRQQALAALDRLPLRTFLPDVLRYLNEPAQRLRDAAPLVRMAVAAHRQTMNYPAWIPAMPHPDTLVLAAPIEREQISETYLAMGRAIDTLAAENSFRQSGEIARELSRMGRLEMVAGAHPQDTAAAVLSLADSLASQDGLGQAIYLHLNPRSGALEGQALGGRPTPPIAIQPEGSTTAAAWALLTRAPVVVTLDAPADAAVLDLQIIRQAGRLAQAAPAAPSQSGGDALAAKVRRTAHEINNPLGIIKNYLAILKIKLGDEAPIADELRIMHEELDRIVRIMRGLVQDEAPTGSFLEPTDVNALIEDLVKVTDPSWQSRGVRIVLALDPALPLLPCDRDKLKQIVLNLLLNALEATPEGGSVRLETNALVNHRQEKFVEILVADSGSGIPAELAGRVFSPVESAKGGGHAGLGLSIVKALTQAIHGTIAFKSHATGTTFQLSFPTATGAPPAENP